jgi:hypothetical protein
MKRRSVNIHERFLRHIWSQQYLAHTDLRTADGKPLDVLDVGTLNLDGGPDFLNARVKVDGITFAGDVEIHRNVAEWLLHRHHSDPAYNKVILHVVLEGDIQHHPTTVQSGRRVPVLVLESFLSESIRTVWDKAILDERALRAQRIKCFRENHRVDAALLRTWIDHLAVERVEVKLRRFEERLKQLAQERLLSAHEPFRRYGTRLEGNPDEIPPPLKELTAKDLSAKPVWEQVLYEGTMEALGYSKNQEPFRRLAENVTLERIKELEVLDNANALEGLLFGAAGLLPKIRSLRHKASREYARGLIRAWHDLRKRYRAEVLHAADWQFFPTRPVNMPTIRLSAAAGITRLIARKEFFRATIQALKSGVTPHRLRTELQRLFVLDRHPFWSTHYHFDEPTSRPVNPLGSSRIDEIIMNVLIPIGLLYARVFKDKAVREGVLGLYRSYPASSENSLTRLMEKQLLKGRMSLKSMSEQQGVIQLYKFYCSEERCQECEVGKVVFSM